MASLPKNKTSNKKKNQPCRFFFAKKHCNYGDECPYSHSRTLSSDLNQDAFAIAIQDPLLSTSIVPLPKNEKFFEQVATHSLQLKIQSRTNRCSRCWHDEQTHCICEYIPPLSESINSTLLPIKVIVLMHYKEYLSAGNDAKLLLAMLPSELAELYVFGKDGDWEKLEEECRIDPMHTLLLWPSEDAHTITEWVESVLVEDSPWKQWMAMMTPSNHSSTSATVSSSTSNSSTQLPVLRVVVLDGVYSHARLMFRTMKRRFTTFMPPHIALHPRTVSIYHRAQKNYHVANYESTVRQSKDPNRMHICTVEAFALLCKELRDRGGGQGDERQSEQAENDEDNYEAGKETKLKEDVLTEALVRAVEVNNMALIHCDAVRPTKKGMRMTHE